MFNRTLRLGRKVRITTGPLKGQTGRLVGRYDDGEWTVELKRDGRWIDIRGVHLEVA